MPTPGEIERLLKRMDVDEDEVHVTLRSECGDFEKTVHLPRRATNSEGHARAVTLLDWVRARVRRFMQAARPTSDLSEAERESALQAAYRSVESQVRLQDGRWVRHRPEQHPSDYFDQQLRTSPITEPYDLEVLVRVLLEVSRSDSDQRVEERAFLREVVTDEAMIERLSSHSRITVAELAVTSGVKVKETILMLAWAMAYADGRLDPEEMDRLTHLCRGFNLPEERVRELQLASKLFLLDRHLDGLRGTVSAQQLRRSFDDKARAWGVPEQQLSRLRSWYPDDFRE